MTGFALFQNYRACANAARGSVSCRLTDPLAKVPIHISSRALSWPKNAIHERFAQSAPITQKGYPFWAMDFGTDGCFRPAQPSWLSLQKESIPWRYSWRPIRKT